MKNTQLKIFTLFFRMVQMVVLLPFRFGRLLLHVKNGVSTLLKILTREDIERNHIQRIGSWSTELLFMLLDMIGIAEIYETIMDFVKWKTRKLNMEERQIANAVFGEAINWLRVRIDERAYVACRHWHLCYVSFYTINSWGNMRPDLLIHELMHVWQYQYLGASYIPKALLAQTTPEGYNYGGIKGLRQAIAEDKTILHFNLEQQADIVADYYCIRKGLTPRWGSGTLNDLPVYEYFIAGIRNPSKLCRHFRWFA